jgi:tetratricopeptide (TPR) repeat protein
MYQLLRIPALLAMAVAVFAVSFESRSALAAPLQPQSGAPSGIIDGRVTGPNRRPMGNVRVDLLNDVYSPLASSYTDGSGRFQFRVTAGVFHIDVEAQGLPFQRQRQRIEVNPISQRDIFRVDIELVPQKTQSTQTGVTGVHFYQQVPEKARAEYERGTKLLKEKPDEAYAALRQALQIFPDYYDAMEMLGSEYVKASYLDHALPILLRAIEVNPKGEMSHYALGVGYYKLNRFAEAAKEFSSALEVNAKSVNAMLYLGLAQMRVGQVAEAEPILKKAYALGAKNVPDLHLALTTIYIKTDRRGDAADQLELLLRESPDLRDKEKIRALIGNLRKRAQQ